MTATHKIEENFNQASHSYQAVAHVQHQCARYLADMLKQHLGACSPRSIFEIGCGTGNLTRALHQHFPQAHYLLNDRSINMLNTVKQQYRNDSRVHFSHGDIEQLAIPNSYDLIASNLCLQWLNDLWKNLTLYFHQAKWVACSFLLAGTFAEWQNRLAAYGIHGIVKDYPSFSTVANKIAALRPHQQCIKTQDFTLHFKRPLELARYLKQLGANTAASDSNNAQQRYRLLKTDRDPCLLSYKVVFIVMASGL